MPFGLTNDPTTFMIFMNDILWFLMGKIVVGFIDDMLVFIKKIKEHKPHLILPKTSLFIDMEKNLLCLSMIEYFGYFIFAQ